MRFLSVCSGMEAASIAFEPLGWKAVGFCEIDPFASAVLAHRFPNTPNYGDLTKYKQWPLESGTVDVLIGGPPCQAFSVAGLRKGLADPRGNLTLTYLGLVDHLRPEWVVYENVPGLLSVDGGRTFGTFLHALGQLGYGWAYRILDAQHVGECRLHPHRRGWSAVPQRRRRIFVVARRGAGGWASAAEVLSLREGVQRHLAAGGKKRQGVAPDAGGGAEKDGRKWPADTACTLNAAFGQKLGLEDQHALGGASLFVMSSGQANAAISENLAHTLNASHEAQTIINPIVIDRAAFNQGENAQYEPHIGEADVMDTVVARGPHAVGLPYSRTGNERVEAEAHAISFQPGNLCRQAGADPSTTTFPTLKCDAGDQAPHVAQPMAVHFDTYNQTVSNISFTLSCSASDANHTGTVFAPPMAVRRLTPNECLRLQGFPDNHTNIPWKGKPEGQAPDGPQYKCAGNSFAVPVVRWIGTRIAAQQ
jgi:DNA (cytosine-5)-methyltransferase 1